MGCEWRSKVTYLYCAWRNQPISLIDKLDAFIRRYHRNKALRGLLLSFATLTVGAGLLLLLESVGRFGVGARTVLFCTFLLASLFLVVTQVLWPVVQWMKLGRGLTYEDAAQIVGNHFPDVKDKLLNTLQLQSQIELAQGADISLLAASIDQRTEALRPLSFAAAIDTNPLLRVVRFAIPLALLASGVMWFRPDWVTEPANRLVQHRTEFVEPAPFEFVLVNDDLRVATGDPLTIEVKVVGRELPSAVLLESMGGRFRMEKFAGDRFRYSFPAVRNEMGFRFLANGWRSQAYTCVPYAVPALADFQVSATPPTYTKLPPIHLNSQGDLTVPEGTPIHWSVRVNDGQGLRMWMGHDSVPVRHGAANTFNASWVAAKNDVYWMTPWGSGVTGDSLRHRLRVIRDGKPSIRVVDVPDSTSRKRQHFSGDVVDDYGFSRLTFVWEYLQRGRAMPNPEESTPFFAGGSSASTTLGGRLELDVPSQRSASFFHTWDMGELDWREGDVIECWFEIWDNDGVHGAKMTRSGSTRIEAPGLQEIREERNDAAESIENDLQDAAQEAAELREAMQAMQ